MFWIFIKVVFSGLKTNHFFLEYQKTIFSGWMCPKIHLRKSLIFWKKEWTQNNFGKILIFWYFFKSLLFKCKSHSFLFGISKNDLLLLDLKKKNTLEKVRVFDEKHGPTLFGRVWFFGLFLKVFFNFKCKNHYFLFEISENDLLLLDLKKKKHQKKSSSFWRKAWTNPFGKFWFFGLFLKVSFLIVKTILFYLEYPKTIFRCLI